MRRQLLKRVKWPGKRDRRAWHTRNTLSFGAALHSATPFPYNDISHSDSTDKPGGGTSMLQNNKSARDQADTHPAVFWFGAPTRGVNHPFPSDCEGGRLSADREGQIAREIVVSKKLRVQHFRCLPVSEASIRTFDFARTLPGGGRERWAVEQKCRGSWCLASAILTCGRSAARAIGEGGVVSQGRR